MEMPEDERMDNYDQSGEADDKDWTDICDEEST